MSRKVIGLLVALALANSAFAEPAQVIIIRHAEKPDNGNQLSLAGKERAAALVPYFSETQEVLQFNTPVAIYAQDPKHETSSLRSIETVKPLADALHLEINQAFTRDEFAKMVDEIKSKKQYDGHMVLICWEHKVIPEIAKAFGVDGAPTKWEGQVFDQTWVITFRENHTPVLKVLQQKLMYGDSDK